MSKIVYDEADSVLIRSCLKIALKSIKSMNILNGENNVERLEKIISEMEIVQVPDKEKQDEADDVVYEEAICDECD